MMQHDALAYLTDEFIRADCGVHHVQLSEQDCARIREEIIFLYQNGCFHHTGVYWVANRLAAEGEIYPILP